MSNIRSRLRSASLFIALTAATANAHAQYRCVENGKTLITDRPCIQQLDSGNTHRQNQGTSPTAATTGYSTIYGTWRGQVQFMARAGSTVINEAHVVTPVIIEIDPKGKVTGLSPETGCRLKGIATPGIVDTTVNIDVTLTQCVYKDYNRRIGGYLALYKGRGYSALSLTTFDVSRRPSRFYEIKGALRR